MTENSNRNFEFSTEVSLISNVKLEADIIYRLNQGKLYIINTHSGYNNKIYDRFSFNDPNRSYDITIFFFIL